MLLNQDFYLKIIKELNEIIDSDNFDYSHLNKYELIYENSLTNSNKLCENCKELEKLELPYDCICKPNYCMKNYYDFEIIILYEEIKTRLQFDF